VDWQAKLAESEAAHAERRAAPPRGRPDLHLAAVASASWAAGLSLLMLRRREEARAMLRRAAEEYRRSWDAAPAASWGRPLAAIRCSLMAGDDAGASADARRALDEGAESGEGPIARYAATLALLALDRDAAAADAVAGLIGRDDFPGDVAEALAALAAHDREAYADAARAVLASFESRDAYLEDVPVADTVLVLAALGTRRGLHAELASPLLPA
jgi:hypothetical protein